MIPQFEHAYRDFYDLLRTTAEEPAYQALFVSHPEIFEALGFARAIPHPILDNGTIPDFLAVDLQGLWTVIDLKRPDCEIVRFKDNRDAFRATVTDGLAQTRRYAAHFDDSANRLAFQNRYGVAVNKHPDRWVVAGRGEMADPALLHELIGDQAARIWVKTYDEILELLAWKCDAHLRVATAGMAFVGLVRLRQQPAIPRKYLFTFGTEVASGRFSVFLDDENDICVEAKAGNAALRQVLPGSRHLCTGPAFELWVNVYERPGFACIETFVDRSRLATVEVPTGTVLGIESASPAAIGCGPAGEPGACFDLYHSASFASAKGVEARSEAWWVWSRAG